MQIYTRKGDAGTTKDFNGNVYEKCDNTINANGTIDELNSHIGNVLINTNSAILEKIQHELFSIGSVVSGYNDEYTSTLFVSIIEKKIDKILSSVPPIRNFILPKGSQACVNIHMCRTVCRRAERDLCRLERTPAITECIKLINRLSDLLFIMAYEQNIKDNNLQLANKLSHINSVSKLFKNFYKLFRFGSSCMTKGFFNYICMIIFMEAAKNVLLYSNMISGQTGLEAALL